MTKVTKLVVTIATDDEVTTDQLQVLMRQKFEGMPMERVEGAEDGRRIHWPTVDVRRLVERTVPPIGKLKAVATPRKTPVPPQGELAS